MRNKQIVISGGTSGIGLATAELFAQDGAEVLLIGRNKAKGLSAAQKIQQLSPGSVFIQADLSTMQGCHNAAQSIKRRGREIDVLVNAAGIYAEGRLGTVTEIEYDELMNINVKGTIFLTQELLSLMSKLDASIINIASDAGVNGNYGCPVYCASKGAVVAFTRGLALDCAPLIRVNCICPGDVATPLVEKQLVSGNYTLAEMTKAYPLARIGKAEEIAHMICAIASPLNGFMTGSIITIDGGLTAG
ncbi:MAG TPA: SDR family oxidoreductase [Candidatus Avacidaminococcus intestinavium]|uniref:SDR family oxidoreductase n=1 Tax=Candidatus Avacidaminococcus intestinavium TaxID=2840684 RepID=A0A9D1SKM5_9FIRM|nr:SDR family oxidoreductase [Candidatus Avacidaminococcus intestinavium]